MKENKKIVVISAAMLDGTGLARAAAEFPDRVFDVGICEQHAVTLAAGLATQGLYSDRGNLFNLFAKSL